MHDQAIGKEVFQVENVRKRVVAAAVEYVVDSSVEQWHPGHPAGRWPTPERPIQAERDEGARGRREQGARGAGGRREVPDRPLADCNRPGWPRPPRARPSGERGHRRPHTHGDQGDVVAQTLVPLGLLRNRLGEGYRVGGRDRAVGGQLFGQAVLPELLNRTASFDHAVGVEEKAVARPELELAID